MEYDLIKLFEHERLCLFEYIPATIVTLGKEGSNECVVHVQWRRSLSEPPTESAWTLKWDHDALRTKNPLIDRQIQSRRESDEDQATRTMETAVAVAVLAHIEPETKLTLRSKTGSRHDYYLNNTRVEMIEMAGEWIGGLPGLFEGKRQQSNQNNSLKKRWVSVTVMRETPRNRTEGLHS